MKKTYKLSVALVFVMSVLLLSSAFASADVLTDLGLKPLGSYDFGGETVTIISWTSDRIPGYFETHVPVMERIQEAEELFNVKIEFLHTRDIPEVNYNRLLAGESTHDLWHAQNKIGYWELVAGGAVLPMSDILPAEYYENLPPSLQATEEAFKYDGKYWGIGTVEWLPLYGYQNDMLFVVYNKTLLEREGIEDLYELYLDGEWTWDKAREIAIKTTRDTDGDGETDQWGIVDLRSWDLAVSNGAKLTQEIDGRVVFTGDEPEYIAALEFAKELWTDLQVAMPTYGSGDLRNTFLNGKAAMYFSVTSSNIAKYVLAEMQDEWGIVPLPKGPNADQHYWTVQAISTTLIPVNAKDPEALAALRAFLWQEDDVTVTDFIASHVRSQDAADVLITANMEWDGTASRVFENFFEKDDTVKQVFRDIVAGNKGAVAGMAEIKPIIQSKLDDLFNQ